MATENRRTDTALSERLYEETYRFGFFQAVRVLERLYRDSGEPVGTADVPDREAIRFRSRLSLDFPASDIGRIERGALDTLPVSFFGVASPHSYGSLPVWYAQLATADEDGMLRDFFDVFNHRLTALFYRAWEHGRAGIAYERTGNSPFEQALFSLIGMGTPGLRGRLPFDDLAMLRRAGSSLRRSARGLAFMVSDYFRVPARVLEFVPKWYTIETRQQMRLGVVGVLGAGAMLGERTRVAQSCFRVRIGPLTLQQFHRFLPGGSGYQSLVEMIRLGSGPEFDFQIQLVLLRQEVPAVQLLRDPVGPARVGWSTWLGGKPDRDPDDAIFSPSR